MSRYDRRLVELLLPAIWDEDYAYGMRDPLAPDADMPRAAKNPKESNTLYAHLADIRLAWRKVDLNDDERRALLLLHGLGLTQRDAGRVLDVSHQTIGRWNDRAVGLVTAWLNGDEYKDGYDSEDVLE